VVAVSLIQPMIEAIVDGCLRASQPTTDQFRSMRADVETCGVARSASEDDDHVTYVDRITRKVRLDELLPLKRARGEVLAEVGHRRLCIFELSLGATEADQGEQLKCDLFHVKNHHPLLELLVLTQTVEVFFLDVVSASNVLKIASAIAMRGACHVPN
jgi:hypothetical protein